MTSPTEYPLDNRRWIANTERFPDAQDLPIWCACHTGPFVEIITHEENLRYFTAPTIPRWSHWMRAERRPLHPTEMNP